MRLHPLRDRLLGDVAVDTMLEIELSGLALATGTLDATVFPNYHIFLSNHTGNTVLLAVGVLIPGDSSIDLRSVGMSLAASSPRASFSASWETRSDTAVAYG